ncbi:MAG: AAA family ATPase, partial [Selenomonas sp.]|nr:AAA family ATPase [Selenomonas sp.]
MLKTLTVWNFALLEHVQVEFGTGLNILTGETGAGKSILIDALGAILGQRVSTDAIRTGCDWLRVEAVFSLEEKQAGLHEFLTSQAIDDADGLLIITRQVTRGGRSMVLVNGCHITLTVLKQIGAFLVDIHGQKENLALLKEESQFALLDSYDNALAEALGNYKNIFETWRTKCQEQAEKEQASREYAQRLDMLRWQDKEISEAELKENEDEELDAEIRKLSHAEKIAGFVEESYNILDVGVGGSAVLTAVAKVKKNLEDMSRYDDSLANTYTMVEEAYISLQEAAGELRDYGESLEFQPAKLDKLQSRMDVIDRLCRKYGATIADVLEHQS